MKRFGWVVAVLVLIAGGFVLTLPGHGRGLLREVRSLFGSQPAVALLVTTDLDCDWKLDGNPQGRLRAKESSIVPSTLGQHLLEARTVDAQDSWKGILEFRAPEQYVAAIPLLDVRQKRLGSGTTGAAGAKPSLSPLASPAIAARSTPPLKSISSQIDEVVGGGRYTNLPQPRSVGSSGGAAGGSRLSIENRTEYELTVLMAGPMEKSLSLRPGATQTLDIPPGSYRVLGRVNASGILPFAGAQTYSAGESYSLPFYIRWSSDRPSSP